MKAALGLLLCATLCACGARGEGASQRAAASVTPVPLIAMRGTVLPFARAVRRLAFRPFVPRSGFQSAALIVPLNVDHQRLRGLALEYRSGELMLLLSEWPDQGQSIEIAGAPVTAAPCTPVAYKSNGFMWATRKGLLMTLQPDGPASAARVEREARRLLAEGACSDARAVATFLPQPFWRQRSVF